MTAPQEPGTEATTVPAPPSTPQPGAGEPTPTPRPEPAGNQPPAAGDAPPRAVSPRTDGPGWAETTAVPRRAPEATTVLPGGSRTPPARPAAARAASPRADGRPSAARPVAARARRARLTWKRIDPWSVFLFTLVASVFLGIALVVAALVLYTVLGALGVTESLNQLYAEVTGSDLNTETLLTTGRVLGLSAVLAAVNVVFLTLLATLGAMLYNLVASFTGGLELTFGERD